MMATIPPYIMVGKDVLDHPPMPESLNIRYHPAMHMGGL